MKQLIVTLVVTLFALTGGHALGADLDQAKQQGLIGERADGYLGLVQAAVPEDVAQLVKSINNKRRTEYERIANANKIDVEQVQALAGKKAIEKTEPGGWVMRNGGWQQK